MGLDQQRTIPFTKAITSWYDNVYLAVIQVIRERDLLRDFPSRTETDLYIWLSKYEAELETTLGWDISIQAAAAEMAETHSEKRGLARTGKRLFEAIVPDDLQSGPGKGEWQRQNLVQRYLDKLLHYILIPISSGEHSWHGLEQAIVIAQRENSQLRGLHMVTHEADKIKPEAQTVAQAFTDRCQKAGVDGRIIFETGPVAKTIIDRARWNDLIVMNLAYPPGNSVAARLGSGFRQIIQRSPQPILAVPRTVSPLDKALVAYDGSPKGKEALFMAAYLAEQWQTKIVVVIAHEGKTPDPEIVNHAQRYLELHELEAQFVIEPAKPADLIMATAVSHECNLIIMGGYGSQPVVEVVLGSTANEILRRTHIPVLICP
jgi:nucleotide-binding universal stress UspA family protein